MELQSVAVLLLVLEYFTVGGKVLVRSYHTLHGCRFRASYIMYILD